MVAVPSSGDEDDRMCAALLASLPGVLCVGVCHGGGSFYHTAEGWVVPDRNDPSVYTLVVPGKESRQCALEFAPASVSR